MSISNTDPVQLLINKHSNVWANHEHDCGLIDFEVCIEGEPPPPQKQYRIKPEAEAAVHEIVKQLEKRGVVRRCSSTTNSPCLPVPKPNGKWRLCIDYQRLNKVLPKATPIVANPSTILSQVSTNASWFTVLDIKNGFWSIKVKQEDQWKLAFTVNQLQYTWERMPQGLHNSPGIFHRAVADTLGPLLGTGEVVHYVDDILVATAGSLENHLQLVDIVLQTLDSRYVFGTVNDFMAQWQLRKFLTSAGTPVKHFNTITAIWQEIQARDAPISVVKVRAHISRNPDVHEQNNNIVDQLAKLAAVKGDNWQNSEPPIPAVSAIQVTPMDLKQYQKDLWVSEGELAPHLKQDQMVKVTEGIVLRDDKFVVPEALQKPIIKLYHDYSHVSAAKTLQLIQRQFWWQLAADTERWCHTCLVCATVNQGKVGRTNLCRPEPPKGPWEFLQLDFIGPLPSAKGGYRYCLVIIDKFSKWVEAIPTRNNTANTVARVLANQIIPIWGASIQIESDQGTHFTGQVMQSMCKMLNIKQRFHLPYRPQSSGIVERLNRVIKENITKQIAQHQNKWIDALPTVLTVLRATPSKATGISPFELMTGRVMKLPIDPEISPKDLGPLLLATQQTVLVQLQERLKVLHTQAALKQQQSDLMNDAQFNPMSETKFSEGDMVMVRVFVKQNAFSPRWHGPYEIKAVCNSCVAMTVRGKLKWTVTAIPWKQDARTVSGPTCIELGQRVTLTHTLGCRRWMLFKSLTHSGALNSFTYGDLNCPANHTFCLEVMEDFSMGQINILGRVPLDTNVSPWWEDTFYEQGTQALVDTMELVQNAITQTEYHLIQAQVEANLAKKTANILSSSSTRSAQDAYTWWDWVFRGCVIGSALIFVFTLLQCCYFRYLLHSLRASAHAAITLSPLQVPALQKLW
ncbi:hypothetical protein QQF64_022193 [Cirrhinus molitorella]|uniref:Gypsy retrotransposon integrase-like protein 1 n=1 Tax=Cirrhinus molitorella TaxID=172907 RepID=A0ABR3L8Y5_9TELE